MVPESANTQSDQSQAVGRQSPTLPRRLQSFRSKQNDFGQQHNCNPLSSAAKDDMDDVLLTDHRIDELLLRAEARLKGLVSLQDSSRSSVSRSEHGIALRYE